MLVLLPHMEQAPKTGLSIHFDPAHRVLLVLLQQVANALGLKEAFLLVSTLSAVARRLVSQQIRMIWKAFLTDSAAVHILGRHFALCRFPSAVSVS
ncbi:hypothetical protein TGMAS_307270 [Toxoplasma gondii MAS]|uniref:Uncharacterized protein n=1 Tax=Toxoplasma gondii MAS TaxID=943118 RepID=A0A086PKG7_TOXGO|nr:hypothetical protein TGMAS_307270 [Toxoplasma gondii MAS]